MTGKPTTAEPHKPRRRWFQFRLRTLLVVIVLLGAACGYVAHVARVVAERRAWINAHPADVEFFAFDVLDGPRPNSPMPLIRRLLGDQSVYAIYCTGNNDADAAALFPEAEIREP